MSLLGKVKLPTFVRCRDGKWYEDLIYQDFPQRRAWFLCFDSEEPAEIVVRESEYKDMGPKEILKRRGFGPCLKGLFGARKSPHPRFFGPEMDALSADTLKPMDGHAAVSWFIIFKKGVALPAPNQYDSCVTWHSFFPNKPGVYFGDNR